MSKQVLSVGQCGFDHGAISRLFTQHFSAQVQAAHSASQALQALRKGAYDLVLVNRVLDEDGSSGLELVGQIKADPDLARIPVLLVSNYPDAQAQAVALGALPGFGKSELGRPSAIAAIQSAFQSSNS